jgi:ATP-dependent Clp protease ATP-binding subunit ClpA
VFEGFTEKARHAVVLAQAEAVALRHHYIGTEHILLGLLREETGVAARALESLGLKLEDARAQVAGVVGHGGEVVQGQIPFTPRAKRALELALGESRALGHTYVGTEHLLLGLAHENEGVAMRILHEFHLTAHMIASAVVAYLGGQTPPNYLSRFSTQPPERFGELLAEDRHGLPPMPGLPVMITGGRTWVPLPIAWATPMILGAALLALGILIGWLIWG